MEILTCDVVGCTRPVAWILDTCFDGAFEDALCQRCWHVLNLHSPQKARCYSRAVDTNAVQPAPASGTRLPPASESLEPSDILIGA